MKKIRANRMVLSQSRFHYWTMLILFGLLAASPAFTEIAWADGCTYTVTPASDETALGAAGGTGIINLTASPSTCSQVWQSTSAYAWLTFPITCSTGICYSGSISGSGSGTIPYKVAPNKSSTTLTGDIYISVLTPPFVITEGAAGTCISCGLSFSDVTAADSFRDYISAIACAGITQGCGSGNYCPSQNVTREQMAAFIVRADKGEPPADYCTNPSYGGNQFNDVSSSDNFCPYIRELQQLGITDGCGPGDYCPLDYVTRDEMAAFLVRATQVAAGQGPEAFTCNGGAAGASVSCATTTPYFSDVPTTDGFFPYVQKLYELEITTGCGNGNYCPLDYVTRDEMAAFLFRSFLRNSCPITPCTTAAVNVTVKNAFTGAAIQGATVTAGALTATTGATGIASFTGLSSNQNQTTPITISVAATDYTTGTTTALLACGTTASASASLTPNFAGNWGFTTVTDRASCGLSSESNNYTAELTQSGNQVTLALLGYPLTVTVSGNVFSWTGSASIPYEEGTLTFISGQLTVASDENSFTGSFSWSWTNGTKTKSCTGTTTATGTRE